MIVSSREIPLPSPQFTDNLNNFPIEELSKYFGQYVAWNLDGTSILASADSMEEVNARLEATGIDPAKVVGDYIPQPHESLL